MFKNDFNNFTEEHLKVLVHILTLINQVIIPISHAKYMQVVIERLSSNSKVQLSTCIPIHSPLIP